MNRLRTAISTNLLSKCSMNSTITSTITSTINDGSSSATAASAVVLLNHQPSRGKCQAGRYRVTLKRNRPLTYEMANKPHYIAVRKGWNSWNTSSLVGVENTGEVTVDDIFIRSFMFGTWHRLFLSEVIIKRRANLITIAGICSQSIPARKYYFLIGYTEKILAHIMKCPVKIDIQTTEDNKALIYKFI